MDSNSALFRIELLCRLLLILVAVLFDLPLDAPYKVGIWSHGVATGLDHPKV